MITEIGLSLMAELQQSKPETTEKSSQQFKPELGAGILLQTESPATLVSAPLWMRILPFFMSAVLFISGIFSIFSPLPLLLLNFQSKLRLLTIACITNIALVALLGGWLSLGIYVSFVVMLALFLPRFLLRTKSIEKSAALTLLFMAFSLALTVGAYSLVKDLNPIIELKNYISRIVDYFIQSLSADSKANLLGGVEINEWKESILLELPSAVSIFSLVLVWSSIIVPLKLNTGRIRDKLELDVSFLKKWKAPELLLWPTIISGFFVVVRVNIVSEIAVNLFKFLMAIYAIHGLSILSFVFDAWKIKGILRNLGYVASLFLMLPLLLSLGFFDLWFDFRAKLRQS